MYRHCYNVVCYLVEHGLVSGYPSLFEGLPL